MGKKILSCVSVGKKPCDMMFSSILVKFLKIKTFMVFKTPARFLKLTTSLFRASSAMLGHVFYTVVSPATGIDRHRN